MFMDLPTIQHLIITTLIRQSTRTSECQLVPCTRSTAGHICVLAGGGEESSFSQAVGQIEKIWLRFALSQPEIVGFTIFYQKD
jgi:hypothetical protein